MTRKQRNPKLFLAAVVASSVVAASVKLYNYYSGGEDNPEVRKRQYTNKSIALTLSNSIINSQLPLNEILLNSENVTFILPPNLSVDDLACNIIENEEINYKLPKALIQNYKLLQCSNLQGYFNIVKNLKPDMLVICSDDLGITSDAPKDLNRFVKEIVNLDQNTEDITTKISPLFIS